MRERERERPPEFTSPKPASPCSLPVCDCKSTTFVAHQEKKRVRQLWKGAMVKAMLLPGPAMALGQGVSALLDQLERHCLAPEGSLVSKPAYLDLLQVRSVTHSLPTPVFFHHFGILLHYNINFFLGGEKNTHIAILLR